MNKDTVTKAIKEGRIKDAIKIFEGFDISAEKKKTLTIIEAEFNQLNLEVLKGTISQEQRQLQLNQINDKLLSLLDLDDSPTQEKKGKVGLIFLLLAGLLLCVFYFFVANGEDLNCPEFDNQSTNKILLIPFENVGGELSKPHLLLRDRIEELTIKKKLSTNILLGEVMEDLTISGAPEVAKSCGANVIIWGKYSKSPDSLNLILQYLFLEQPDWSKMNDLHVLKDVVSIQRGEMFKDLEDSIMSLCSIISIRQNEKEVAQKWLGNVKKKDELDIELIKVLNVKDVKK